MRKTSRPVSLFLAALTASAAHAGWTLKSGPAETSAALRGFGAVSVQPIALHGDGGENALSGIAFAAEDAVKAECLAGKFLHDLGMSHGVERRESAGQPYLATPGGTAFAAGWQESSGVILGGDEAALRAFLAAPGGLPFPVRFAASGDFPEYMLRFGWGSYGMGGFDNMLDWMAIGGRSEKDPEEDFAFHLGMDDGKAGPMHFDGWLDPASFDNSDGLMGSPDVWWERRFAAERGVPVSYRVYGEAGGFNWSQRRFPDHMNRPADFMVNGWLRYHDTAPHFSWYDADIHKYIARTVMDSMAKLKEPRTRGWMHPHGELVHQPWYDMHQDVSPAAHEHWRRFLAARGITAPEAEALYGVASGTFRSLDDVPVPEFAHFSGLVGRVLDLAGVFRERTERGIGPVPAGFWDTPPEERDAGIRERWYLPETDLSAWGEIAMPGNPEFIPRLYPEIEGWNVDGSMVSHWFCRDFDWDPALAGGKRVWLYFFPMSESAVHSAEGGNRRHRMYLNGRELGGIGAWGALDATDALREGANVLAFQLHGCWWRGRIFLSVEEPRTYPGLFAERDRLWTLWDEWRRESKADAWATILDGMRQVDPGAPVKFMAPEPFGTRLTYRLCRDWGGFPHFTGEGIWFYPWYKRYGKLYGVPATSELAGPSDSMESLRTSTLRVFLAGLDGHEPVFLTQMYSRRPELRDFLLRRRNVLRRIGTYDIAGPQVVIYRQCPSGEFPQPWPVPGGAAAHATQSAWNWDIGRGSLQSLGHSPLYIDDDGLAEGLLRGMPLLVDCGNEAIPLESLAAIRGWVEEGGVFVTMPFTGRSGPGRRDDWPISALTGCAVAGERPLGGEIRLAEGQTLFPDLAGRTFRDEGRVFDWQGNNHNEYSVELAPGPDAEAVALYENGTAAIAARRLGKGLVIACGTAFWRDVADRQGIWWPGEGERGFLRRLLAAAGFPPPACETDDPLAWIQPYRSNNGLDAVAVLCDFNASGDREVGVTLRTGSRPRRIVLHAPGRSAEVPFEWDDASGAATLRIPSTAQEVSILEAETHGPSDAIAHWWDRQRELWRPTIAPSIDFSPYREGRWKNPTLPLSEEARFTTTPPADGWDADPAFDDSAWTPAPISVPYFWGAAPGAPVWYRKTFDLDEEWRGASSATLAAGIWQQGRRAFLTPTRIVLNGVELQGFASERYAAFEVAPLLRPEGNVLALEMQPGEKYAGCAGMLWLYRRETPALSIDLSGDWTGEGGKILHVPGEAVIARATKVVAIPAEWEGMYRVRVWMDSERDCPLGLRVNGHLVRRHHHDFGHVTDVDITGFLRFGEDNVLVLARDPRADFGEHRIRLDTCRLDLFETP